jgi:hypothetical protein
MAVDATRATIHANAATFAQLANPAVDFVHVGVQKAGSSWLHQALSRHPELFVGRGNDDKDTCFFSYHHDRGYEWYERHFGDGRGARLRGEVSTSYFPCRDAPARIARYNPDMKILVCLRNPVDRLISNHLHEIRLGHVSARNYALAEGIRNNPDYLEQSRYYTLLVRWLAHIPLERIHITVFERLFEEPAAHLAEIYRFLGVAVEPCSDFPEEKVNAQRVPISRTVDAITRRSSQLLKSMGMTSAVDTLKRAGLHRITAERNSRPDPEALIGDTLRRELHQHFREDIAALAAVTGIDLDIWSPDRHPLSENLG